MRRALVLIGVICLGLSPGRALADPPTRANDQVEASLAALGRQDNVTARQLAEEAARSGDPLALNNLVVFLENGIGGPKDQERARDLLERAAKGGLPIAKVNLATRLQMSPSAEDQARSFNLLQEAAPDARAGPLTFWPLGRAYLFGFGVAQDLARGVDLLEASLKVDANSDAYYLLARAYQSGWGGRSRDDGQAFLYFEKSAEMGNAQALRYVGMARLTGAGTPRDPEAAMADFRRAVEMGNAWSMIDIAVMLATGEGVPADPPQARTWYMRAAEAGSAHGLRGLGVMFLRGEGGPVDAVNGRAYLELAVEAGEPNAQKIMAIMGDKLPNADRTAIDSAKASWLRSHPRPAPD